MLFSLSSVREYISYDDNQNAVKVGIDINYIKRVIEDICMTLSIVDYSDKRNRRKNDYQR